LKEKSVEVVWDAKEVAVSIEADHGALNQVFSNLIMNAAQAGATKLTINVKDEGEQCRILIADNGSGIPKEIMPKIYDAFFTTKDVGSGTGLGLNIVQRIVRAHSGEIQVQSEIGKGTTFEILIPKAYKGATSSDS
jgi:signal transduction histidine kinase